MTYAVRLEKHKTKDEILERYLNTVFFGQNSYGIAAAAETYFGKNGRRPHVRRGGVPGRARAGAVELRPDHPSRAEPQPVQPGARPAARGRVRDAEADSTRRWTRSCCPSACSAGRSAPASRTYYSEALRDYLLNRSNILGDTYEERYTRLYRGGLQHPHHARPVRAGAGRRGPQPTARQHARHRRRRHLARHQDRRDPGDGRRARVHPRSERGQPGAGAEPDRIEHQVVRPGGGAAGGRHARGPDRRHPSVHAAQPGRSRQSGVPASPAASTAGSTRCADHTVRSINCAFSRLAQIVGPQPHGRHRVPDGVEPVPLSRPAGRGSRRRSSPTVRSRSAPTR